jgi:hypothetical protein
LLTVFSSAKAGAHEGAMTEKPKAHKTSIRNTRFKPTSLQDDQFHWPNPN